MGMKLDLSP